MNTNLKAIGAGMGRTGTSSLKLTLELLLGGNCFHYLEYKIHPGAERGYLNLFLNTVTHVPDGCNFEYLRKRS